MTILTPRGSFLYAQCLEHSVLGNMNQPRHDLRVEAPQVVDAESRRSLFPIPLICEPDDFVVVVKVDGDY